jgi:murein DD-endopeptidase MepM/ murein hydrolase activator NlpD
VPKPALTPVKNARWGYVRFAGPANGYGNVVIIESPRDFEPSTNPSKWKNPYCQVFAHLRPDSYLAATKAKLGKTIDRGTIVGRLGYSNENGGYAPHLHYGIRKGRYSSTWVYYGYWPTTKVRDQWLKGSTIIKNY